MTFLASLLNLSDSKTKSASYHSQKLWETVKSRYLGSLGESKIWKVSEWVNETLVIFCEHEVSSIEKYGF